MTYSRMKLIAYWRAKCATNHGFNDGMCAACVDLAISAAFDEEWYFRRQDIYSVIREAVLENLTLNEIEVRLVDAISARGGKKWDGNARSAS